MRSIEWKLQMDFCKATAWVERVMLVDEGPWYYGSHNPPLRNGGDSNVRLAMRLIAGESCSIFHITTVGNINANGVVRPYCLIALVASPIFCQKSESF